jgi:hypothetical protein
MDFYDKIKQYKEQGSPGDGMREEIHYRVEPAKVVVIQPKKGFDIPFN